MPCTCKNPDIHAELAYPNPIDPKHCTGLGRVEVFPLVRADLIDRELKGIATYGETLKTLNGRHALQDAYEEALDLALYLRQAIEESKRG